MPSTAVAVLSQKGAHVLCIHQLSDVQIHHQLAMFEGISTPPPAETSTEKDGGPAVAASPSPPSTVLPCRQGLEGRDHRGDQMRHGER